MRSHISSTDGTVPPEFVIDIEPMPPRGYPLMYVQDTPRAIAESRITPDDFIPEDDYPEDHPTREYLRNASIAAAADIPFTPPIYKRLNERLEGQNLHFPPPAFEVPGQGNMLAALASFHATETEAQYYREKYSPAGGRLVNAAAEVSDELFFERAALMGDEGGGLFGEADIASDAIAQVYHLPTHRAA